MDVKGRVALVTGAASGIGKSCAIELLNQGAKVSVCDIDADEGEKLVETLTTEYGKDRVIFCQCDVTDYSQFEESFQTTISTFGHIDIVINNAGIMNDRFWELEVDINVNGVIRGTLLAQRFMGTDKGGQGGIVVNIGSNVSINPYVSVPVYSATKAAIVNFTRAYGHQYHVDLSGVKVMALCPSATDSKLLRDVSKQLLWARYEDAWHRDVASSVPQRPEHVAKALLHILNTGKSGSIWLVENDQPPHEINFPKDYSDSPKPILDPACKVAVVVGGSDGFGFAAADHLLQKGARNYMSKTIRVGLKILGKNHGGPGGIIVNCASILGFIGWPEDPFPIYCKHEPAIEVTMDFAEEFNIEETGVRMVALCPTNKQFRDIGLPCFPDPIPRNRIEETPPCIPTSIGHIGSALSHVIAWGKNGSAWLVEPANSVHEIPRLIHFPSKKGEKVDPKVYEEQHPRYCFIISLEKVCRTFKKTRMNVKDKIAVITGGASGIGFSTAEQLLHGGAKTILRINCTFVCIIKRVAILDLPNLNGETAIEKLESQFGEGRAFFFPCDVTSQDQVDSTFKKLVERLGHIDILINSAGIADDTKWERMIDVNFTGVVRTNLVAIDLMGKHNGGKGGTIVNVASVAGITPQRYLPVYGGTKYALVAFTSSIKFSYNKTGVRMMLICPGMTTTPLTVSKGRIQTLKCIEFGQDLEELQMQTGQSSEHVAKAMIELIEKGENGATCVVTNAEPPYLVDIPTIFNLTSRPL
ncbi:uncharacterized protein LOC143347313 [Colletes latitarsis]|uniref:uncharacterized protein LOC143347313 n=1 Tax=Colletes latitarsis TaxID=2605962 RepID=UPI00403700EA